VADSIITVLCVDDHSLIREGLSLIIDLQDDLKVVATAATGLDAVACFRQFRPAVTLMDLRLPDMSGAMAIEMIRQIDPEARIVALTMYGGDEDIFRALHAGAYGYLLKDVQSDVLVSIIRQVHQGQRPIPPEIAARLADRMSHPTLTARELDVINLLPKGMRNKEIAVALRISEETVQVHVKNIFAKLRVNDRTAAVAVALRRGIITMP
jgi:two-component system, NarL family, response regulator